MTRYKKYMISAVSGVLMSILFFLFASWILSAEYHESPHAFSISRMYYRMSVSEDKQGDYSSAWHYLKLAIKHDSKGNKLGNISAYYNTLHSKVRMERLYDSIQRHNVSGRFVSLWFSQVLIGLFFVVGEMFLVSWIISKIDVELIEK